MPLWELVSFCHNSEFFSYVPLVPFISGYLLFADRRTLPRQFNRSPLAAALWGGAGLLTLGLYALFVFRGGDLDPSSYLALMTAALECLLLAGAFWFLGKQFLRAAVFPVAFMAFFIPPPLAALGPIEAFFQQFSAWTALGLLKIARVPVSLDVLDLHLPNIILTVAPECSGIHSTMVLLMVSLLAGHMFLRSKWRRAFLVAFIVPLAIARNGFRIFVLGELCTHLGPQMIDSPIHHHGGPIFFALSLIPFFLLLVFLRKSELNKAAAATATAAVSTSI